ncbi:MAG: PA14 domain-containing protein, partial [Planctomycetaceae bacterium]
RQVEALVHFLASTGTFHHTLPNGAAVGPGETLFHSVGCVACHGSRRNGAKNPAAVVPLGKLSEKYSVNSLTQFLSDPLKSRPSGRMPHLNLARNEANAIASYFLKDVKVPANLTFKYYEGRWPNLPDFSKITPKAGGRAAGFNLKLARRTSNFAIRFEGFQQVPRDGDYTFFLRSDDGAKLFIDGKLVVNNDGEHAPALKTGKTKLTAGPHAIAVEFAQVGGGMDLRVGYQGPGVPRQPLANAVTATKHPPRPEKGFKLNPALVAEGRKLFAGVGCASCHEMKDRGTPVTSRLSAKPLSELQWDRGCVAPVARGKSPWFGLAGRQRAALTTAAKIAPAPPTPQSVVHQTMVAMNCYACHSRGKIGGPIAKLDALFATTTKEMGDEGRIPPPLDGVGDKLTDAWMKHVLADGANDRPYMLTKMPKFGAKNVGHLAEAFAKLDRKSLVEPKAIKSTRSRLKSGGRKLVGDKVFSCIKCHTFGKYKATGIQSLDLTQMTARIRRDWFFRYMMKPIRYRPGTRMPTPFPGGISTAEKVLDGQPDTQLTAMWEYLKDGRKARTPSGLIHGAIELRAVKEPVVYRNFIQGVSPRGIAVGYPGGLNLAFDADRMVLALAWHGPFIDAAKHWIGRGPGFQGPLGDHVLSLPREAPFAALAGVDAQWPRKPAREEGYRFLGYRLNKQRQPIFRYRVGAITVDDHPEPVPGEADPSLKRTLTLTSKAERPALLYLAAVATKEIKPRTDGWYQIDDVMRVRVTSAGKTKPIVRKNGGRFELLVPVTFAGNEAKLVHEYVW